MSFATITLLGFVLAAEPSAAGAPPAPDAAELRRRVEKSLPFLEKGAVEWVQTKKCVTCHHVPMMLWTHYEAKRQGFAVNDKTVRDLESQALTQYLGHPELTPTGQDTGFMEKKLGPGTVYLSLALQANPAPTDESTKALDRFRENFAASQNDNGSWTTKVNQPPLVDNHDSMTGLILAALGSGKEGSKASESRGRGVKWLKEAPAREESQPNILRLLVAAQGGDKDEIARGVERLRGQQQPDGGWNQVAGRASDALATGQALYALSAAGVPREDASIQRGLNFLISTQKEDGSWLVPTRNKTGHDPIISFYGTGWATLGLIRTLPQPVGAGK